MQRMGAGICQAKESHTKAEGIPAGARLHADWSCKELFARRLANTQIGLSIPS